MAVQLSCPQGHKWESAADRPAAAAAETCPVCGALNTTAESQADPWDTVAEERQAPGQAPATFAGYELLGELGRGGMGVVYKARQVSLDRPVALKVIASGTHAGSQELSRFRIEVEAVARLQHPNIVQVHEVGAHDGCPFFSMEFVAGGSLDRQLKGTLPSPAQAAALTATLARAMHFVHEHGIIHRDLKPGNILLASQELRAESPEPRTGSPIRDSRLSTLDSRLSTPKITDFGLAKRLDQDSEQTRSGAVLGTPSYMAPEQAQGNTRAIGPGTDIYALGAILYELLTGRPPFRGATVVETVRQVIHDEPVAPTRLQPRLPRDLETICLRCLHKEPRRRYATAEALADDLERFGRGEPVLARPIGRAERLWKWAQRRKAIASLIGVSIAAAVLLLGIGIAAYFQVRAERDVADERRAAAKRSAERSLQAVRQIIDVAQERLVHVPRMEQHRRALLAEAITLYEALLKEDPQNVEVRRDAAIAYQHSGGVLQMVGETEQAEIHLRRSHALRAALAEQFPEEAEYQHELALGLKGLGWHAHEAGRHDEARDHFRRAIAALEPLPREPALRRKDLAACHYELAISLWTTNINTDAEKHHRIAQDIWKQLVVEFPTTWRYWDDLGASHLSLGSVLRGTGRFKEAEAEYRAALAAKERVTDREFLARPYYRFELARIHNNLGQLLRQGGKPVDAEASIAKAAELQEHLAEDFPTVPLIRLELGGTHFKLAALYRDTHRADRAAASFRRAQEVWHKLAEDFAREAEYQKELANAHESLGDLHAQTGRLTDADMSYQSALDLWKKLVARHAGTPLYRERVAGAESKRGDVLADQGKTAAALQAYRRAFDLYTQLARDFPAVAAYQSALANTHDSIGTRLRVGSGSAEGEKEHRLALAIRAKLAKENPAEPAYQTGLAHSQHSLALLLESSGQLTAAEELFRQALATFALLAKKHSADPDHRRNLSTASTSLATLFRVTGKDDEAAQLQQQALEYRTSLAKDFPQVPKYRQLLAHTHFNIAGALLDANQAAKAEEPLREALAIAEPLCREFPSQPDYGSDLGAIHNSMGNMFRGTRRPDEALASWAKAIAVQERLIKDFPDNPQYRFELAMTHSNQALVLLHDLKRLDDAATSCAAARTILEELVRQFPDVPLYRHILGNTLYSLAGIAVQREQWPEARKWVTQGIAQYRAALKPYPAHAGYRRALREQCQYLGQLLIYLREHAAAAQFAEEVVRSDGAGWEERLFAGRLLAQCLPLVAGDKALSRAQRDELTKEYTDRALEHLRAARAKGWKDAKELKHREFDALRKHKEFQRWQEE